MLFNALRFDSSRSKQLFFMVLTVAMAAGAGLGSATEKDPEDTNSKNARSRGARVVPVEESVKWAFLIGCDQYENQNVNPLQFCRSDVEELRKTLINHCGYKDEHVFVYTDSEPQVERRPSRRVLERQLKNRLKAVREGDTVLVFFSGHGFQDPAKEKGYLGVMEVDPDNVEGTAYPLSKLQEALEGTNCKQKLLVLDCCHSGSDKSKSAPDDAPGAGELAEYFTDSSGLIVLASCKKDEKSYEWDQHRQGLFTYWLIQGLQGKSGLRDESADYDSNSWIDADELHRYVKTNVEYISTNVLERKRQSPVRIVTAATDGTFLIAPVKTVSVKSKPVLPNPEPVLSKSDPVSLEPNPVPSESKSKSAWLWTVPAILVVVMAGVFAYRRFQVSESNEKLGANQQPESSEKLKSNEKLGTGGSSSPPPANPDAADLIWAIDTPQPEFQVRVTPIASQEELDTRFQARDVATFPRNGQQKQAIDDPFQMCVYSEKAAYLTIVNLGTSGKLNLLLQAQLIPPGKWVVLDGPDQYNYWKLTGPEGVDRFKAIFTVGPIKLFPDHVGRMSDLGLRTAAGTKQAVHRVVKQLGELPAGEWSVASFEFHVQAGHLSGTSG